MAPAHRRFELLDVMFGDLPIGRCTIDQWQDARGQTQWSARVLMDRAHGTGSGQLVGHTRDAQYLSGPAVFGSDQEGPRGARTVLVELHGTGPLVPIDPPPASSPG